MVLALFDTWPLRGDVPTPEIEVRVFTHTADQGLEDVATGDFYDPAYSYAPIPVDPKYRHALTFQMSQFFPGRREVLPGSGPLILFSDNFETLVFSPLNHPYISVIDVKDGTIRYGVSGDVRSIPEGFEHKFILVNGQGINATVAAWGEQLRQFAGKAPVSRYADVGLSYLGYWTDAGAAYYWKTLPDKNAEQTLLAVKAEADRLRIPYRYFQIDSWWYYTKKPGLVVKATQRWEPRPDVFPDGLAAFREKLGLPLIAHSRWYGPKSDPVSDFPFTVESRVAIPEGRAFLDHVMANAESWGIVTYEQDWLMRQFWWSDHLRDGVDHKATFMANMDEAAADAGLTMQICMAGPAHVMDSVNRRTWTTVRSSIDYRPELAKEAYWPQFHIANMIVDAVGLRPFKDNFRTAEAHGEAEALISILSAGMVGPSDEVNEQDAALLMRTCRADGLLLKPDAAAKPIDSMFLDHQRPFITTTHSQRADGGIWTYLAAYHMARRHPERKLRDRLYASGTYDLNKMTRFFVFPKKVTDWRVDLKRDLGIDRPVVAYDWRDRKARVVQGAFDLPKIRRLYDFDYLVLAPIFENGLALIGETGKFVTMADKRFEKVEIQDDSVTAHFIGVPGEVVTLRAYDARANRMLAPVGARIGTSGKAKVTSARPTMNVDTP
ncbi:MAG: hypothetical protein H6684_09395 [Deltaproteobacteria bacterium]|nr:hypothetical protein [Deltaproteobacteria bacterium]